MSRKLLVLLFLFIPSWGWSQKSPKNVIGAEQARKIAAGTQVGVIKSDELEFENGLWIYSYDILGGDKKIHEVQINAITGKVVGNKIESATQEAAEKD